MIIDNNFKIDKYKITGFTYGEENDKKIAMHLNGYLVCEFDRSKTYEFLVAMLGKKYLERLGYDKARFVDEYNGNEVEILEGTFIGKVAFVLKENNGLEDVVGISGVNDCDELVAEDTDELFKDIDELKEENEELL